MHTKPNLSIYAFGWNTAGLPAAYLPGRGSFYSIGEGLNQSDATALNDAVQALQRNLLREVV